MLEKKAHESVQQFIQIINVSCNLRQGDRIRGIAAENSLVHINPDTYNRLGNIRT